MKQKHYVRWTEESDAVIECEPDASKVVIRDLAEENVEITVWKIRVFKKLEDKRGTK